MPVLTVLRAESTECGPTYVAGGRREDRATRAWYHRLARAIGGDRVVIAFEPDSLGTINCLAGSRRDDRLRLLRYGVKAHAQSCGGRRIGWFLPRALSYARLATDWERPPAGTRRGHKRRYPPRAFGIPR